MDYIFFTGLIGSLVLVTGSAWPDKKRGRPIKSIKNWLFTIGGILMLYYAIFGYLTGGPIFFIYLETLVVIASILMMINIDDRIDASIIGILGTGFIILSLYLFEGYSTIFFIIGLSGIGLGYAFKTGTKRRSAALFLGAALIALFSYIEQSWIFFWLNVFFAVFSAYYLVKAYLKHV
jgi:hypothetical protein